MRQHQNLPTMVSLVGEHIRKHRPTRRPHRHPTPPRELRDSPLCTARECIGQHPQTLLRAFLVRDSRLLHRAPKRIERSRTLQMRRRIPNPHQPAVMQMRKQRSNRPPAPFLTRRIRTPRPRIKMRQQNLVHGIVYGVRLDQNRGKLLSRSAALIQTHSRSHPQSPRTFDRSQFCHPERSISRSEAKTNAQSKDPYPAPESCRSEPLRAQINDSTIVRGDRPILLISLQIAMIELPSRANK